MIDFSQFVLTIDVSFSSRVSRLIADHKLNFIFSTLRLFFTLRLATDEPVIGT